MQQFNISISDYCGSIHLAKSSNDPGKDVLKVNKTFFQGKDGINQLLLRIFLYLQTSIGKLICNYKLNRFLKIADYEKLLF